MQIETMKLADLKPAEYNPRVELTPDMVEYQKLKQSILEFGFVDPPIFNKRTGNLVGGHQRIAVAKELNLCEEIEVSVVDLPLAKEKALNMALNKISGHWDDEKLTELLKSIETEDLRLTGFNEEELSSLLTDYIEGEADIYDGLPDEVMPVETFALNVLVRNEKEQSSLFEELTERGFSVKVVNL